MKINVTEMNLEGKDILDATCGSRMMWFNKTHPQTVYADKRNESYILCDGRALEISPDIQYDFTDMPFPDESFHLVVFDPPHLSKLGDKSWLAMKYGKLVSTWEVEIKAGFEECIRVLKPNGVLIFKWSKVEISVTKVLGVIGRQPLFGHPTKKGGNTIWMTFMKTE